VEYKHAFGDQDFSISPFPSRAEGAAPVCLAQSSTGAAHSGTAVLTA